MIYNGEFYMADITDFTVSVIPTVTATPLPPGLPLFMTALIGLGAVVARRKIGAASRAA